MSLQPDMSAHHAHPSLVRVIILGSTGSVGQQTLEVIEHLNALSAAQAHPTRYQIVGLAAGSRAQPLLEQAGKWGVTELALTSDQPDLSQPGLNVRTGADAPTRLVEDVPCDLVVGSIVGIAGLPSVLRAVEMGTDVALANKETLVAAGSLVIDTAHKSGARLLPLDSEHAGVWQCLRSIDQHQHCPPVFTPDRVSRVVLTASGGAFRDRTREQVAQASLEQALNHPNWDMGAKVTIDTATLMNKGLELIEAHWLFGLPAAKLGAVIHPQSIVHAMIECADGSVIAQLGAADMKGPIQHALCFGDRPPGCAPRLDVTKLGSLEFRDIDDARFPAISLALRVIEQGGDAGAALNAANEQAVSAYIQGQLDFGRIDECVLQVMNDWDAKPLTCLDDVYDADARARQTIDRLCITPSGGR